MNLDHSLAELAWAQLWQLTVAIVAVGALTALCCRRRPHLAYALWMIVLVKGLTPPLWTSNVSLFGQLAEPPVPAWWPAEPAAAATPVEAATAAADLGETSTGRAAPRGLPERPLAARVRALPWRGIWAGGAAGVILLAGVMIVRRNRALDDDGQQADATLAALVASLARQLRLRAAPPIVISPTNMGPAVCGVFRPRLLLPRCVVERSTPDELRPMLMHELVHLRRMDNAVAAVQFVFQAVWWFHPLSWWANRVVCRLRESCCDAETVTALDESPRRYARALVNVLEAKQRVRPVFGFPGVRPVEVTARRIKEVLTMSDRFLARTPATCWLAALTAGALVLPAGRATPVASAQSAAKETPAPAATAKPESKPVLLLKYGDGKADGKKSMAGAGEMIRFKMPQGQTNALKALRIHCSRYGHPQPPKEDVEITILNEDMTESLHTELVPYALFKRQAEARWTTIPFDDVVDVPETFWVVLNFNAEATKGVYVSYDTSTKGEHSRVGFNDQDAEETDFKGDWMIQAVLAK